MDESTLESLRHRVPILDGEYFHEWKNEMYSCQIVNGTERIEKRCLEGGD